MKHDALTDLPQTTHAHPYQNVPNHATSSWDGPSNGSVEVNCTTPMAASYEAPLWNPFQPQLWPNPFVQAQFPVPPAPAYPMQPFPWPQTQIPTGPNAPGGWVSHHPPTTTTQQDGNKKKKKSRAPHWFRNRGTRREARHGTNNINNYISPWLVPGVGRGQPALLPSVQASQDNQGSQEEVDLGDIYGASPPRGRGTGTGTGE